jgi:hypothetical protein
MPYADRQHGEENGSWVGRVRLAGKTFKRSFADWDEAEDYERYVRRHGKEPAGFLATGVMTCEGPQL